MCKYICITTICARQLQTRRCQRRCQRRLRLRRRCHWVFTVKVERCSDAQRNAQCDRRVGVRVQAGRGIAPRERDDVRTKTRTQRRTSAQKLWENAKMRGTDGGKERKRECGNGECTRTLLPLLRLLVLLLHPQGAQWAGWDLKWRSHKVF